MRLIIDILFSVLLCISLAGLGTVFLRKLLKIEIDFFTGFFTGCGLAILILFITGILDMFGRDMFIVLFLVIFIFVVPGIRKLLQVKFTIDSKYVIPFVLLGIVLIVIGLSSLSPPIKDDTLYYNLALPKLWAADGGIRFYPSIAFSATALNSELLLTPILSFCSPEAAQFFVFLIGLIAMFLLAEGIHRHTNIPHILIFLLLGAVPTYLSIMVNAKNDYLSIGFSIMAALFYFDYLKSMKSKHILLAGAFAGLAAGTKTNAIIFIMAMFVLIVLSRHRLKDIALFYVSAVILGLPWYLKAYIATGNPVYPFFNNIFDSPYWHNIFDIYNKATFVESEHKSLFNFITSPLRLVYSPDIFRCRLGPAPFVFLPLLIFIRPVPGIVKKALLITGIFFVFWYLAWPNARYLMPVIPLLSFAAAFVIDRLFKMNRICGFIAITGLCLIFILTGVQVGRDGVNRIKTALGIIDKDHFLKTETVLDPNVLSSAKKKLALPYYDIWQFINSNSQDGEVVGILCSNWYRADGFYLDRRYYYFNPTEQVIVDFTGSESSIEKSLRELSIDYILIDNMVVEEFSDSSIYGAAPGFDIFSKGVENFVKITKQNGRLIYSTDRFGLYRVGKFLF